LRTNAEEVLVPLGCSSKRHRLSALAIQSKPWCSFENAEWKEAEID
jgi:hypothetical protein